VHGPCDLARCMSRGRWTGVPEPASPTVRRRRLAAELRRLRERAEMTGDEVAERVGWSASKLSRIENAHTGPRPAEIRKLLGLYGIDGSAADALVALAQEAKALKGWWEPYSQTLPPEYAALIGMEAEARSAWSWAPLIVPGLLQTADYAHAATDGMLEHITPVSPAETRRRVQARLSRQQVLTRENPLELSAILDESVLYRRLGNANVMQQQLNQLLELADRDNITVRILPLDGRHPIGTGAFVLLQFDDVHDVNHHDVVYLEHLISGRYVEEEDEAFTYRRAFGRLSDFALEEAESRRLISAARKKWLFSEPLNSFDSTISRLLDFTISPGGLTDAFR
jgi:transcriptional regulator with XRE-family HTH domain